jgi:hypothetical protein
VTTPVTSDAALRPEDVEQLRLLSIFHYVVAGMMALFASFPVIHLAIGLTMVFAPGAMGMKDPQEGLAGWFFVAFAAIWMAIGWSLAVCTVLAGRSLAARRRYMFCFVVAAVMCVTCMPFGTVLGVFTIVVLLRPQVKAAFGRPA